MGRMCLALGRRYLSGSGRYQLPIQGQFYYDTLCPRSWLTFEILLRYRPVWNLQIEFKPVSSNRILKESGITWTKKLRSSQNYVEYFFKDLVRMGELFKVPISIPESPFYLFGAGGSDNQLKFLTVIGEEYPDLLEEASRQIWYRVWCEDMDANKTESLMVIADRLGLEAENALNIIDKIPSKQEQVNKNSEEALAAGVFDLPFLILSPYKSFSYSYHGTNRFELIASDLKKPWKGYNPSPEEFTPMEKPPNSDIFVSLEVFDEIQEAMKKSLASPPEKEDR